jgi:ParB-like chromosome segregation protein Spo0J
LSLSKLRPAPRNANVMSVHLYGALVSSIRRVGFIDPILARDLGDGSYEIVDGHHRSRAAVDAGLGDVPALVLAGDEDPKLVALALNRIRGETDLAVAAEIVQELLANGLDEVDLSMTGFTDAEIRELASALDTSEPSLDDVGGLSTPEEVGTRPAKPFLLELTFRSKEELALVRKALRKAAGKGNDLSEGMLVLVGHDR